jgi:C4-dicarboxylate-specific signal transduction histidine kinase
LGLAVSRRIIEEHGGAIEAANNRYGGASFTVYLRKSTTDEHK